MSTRPLLAEQDTTEHVRQAQSSFEREIVDEVRRTVERDPLVVVGMAQNPFVKKVRRALQDAGLSFTYLEYGSYLGAWRKRLAIKLWSGWPTFPQVYVKGVLIGGNAETVEALADGSLRKRLDGEDD
ncbi:glutaredoxin domain-containing protein [Paraliomyxa miuraensis]|uniref:glutaredoxin domain-containing protein n=1 Tax=Paraliomyxa miuraensis TaxID=376150 RepID=UPI00225638F0|nr:glutaredoxin domain-containing protein [Paraliomyxa miuraensis]MCX4241974.1 glutaredoxin [Paraliomyxa miuraensis]